MFLGLVGHAAKKIAAAHDDGHLDAEIAHIGKFSRDFMNAGGVDAEALSGGQGFAGDFQQDAFEDRIGHEKAGPSLRSRDDNRSYTRKHKSKEGRRSAPELCRLLLGNRSRRLAALVRACPAWW